MNYLMHALGTFGALALGWYAGHEPFEPLPQPWRIAIVALGMVAVWSSLGYFTRRM